MVGYSPAQNDDYVAVSRQAPEGYIGDILCFLVLVGFEPFAHADRVHHMLLYGCAEPAFTRTFWKGYMTCGPGVAHILYAWAKNAPNLILPNDVAFSVGHPKDGIRYLVLQVHYAQPFAGDVRDFSGLTLHMSPKMPRNLAAVLLFVSGEPIPPGLRQVQINMSCEYNGDIELHPFAFRTHTHAMGRVVSAYYKHNGIWNKIGSRNPQWPQLFEMIPTTPVIRKGDLLAATCRFDSYDKTQPVPMGSMSTNEMCNFYMMFYWNSTNENPFPWGAICNGNERMNEVRSEYPKEGAELLPSRPYLEHHAHQSKVPFGVVEEGTFSSIGDVKLGQVVGLSFMHNNVIIFHRANRVWDRKYDLINNLYNMTLAIVNAITIINTSRTV
uniref:peptidylglycine monooxygenase n=1 Tax=Angiostrongylus cantonensis TaxID=6313 RepID=A0A0K0D010_ANGCA